MASLSLPIPADERRPQPSLVEIFDQHAEIFFGCHHLLFILTCEGNADYMKSWRQAERLKRAPLLELG